MKPRPQKPSRARIEEELVRQRLAEEVMEDNNEWDGGYDTGYNHGVRNALEWALGGTSITRSPSLNNLWGDRLTKVLKILGLRKKDIDR